VRDFILSTVFLADSSLWSRTSCGVRDQREESAKNIVASIKSLTSSCKQLSDRSIQMYELLTEDPELKNLEAQLQEA
jgi:hypothetical protein